MTTIEPLAGTDESRWAEWSAPARWPALDLGELARQPLLVVARAPGRRGPRRRRPAGCLLAGLGADLRLLWATDGEASHPGRRPRRPDGSRRSGGRSRRPRRAGSGRPPHRASVSGCPTAAWRVTRTTSPAAAPRRDPDDLVLAPWRRTATPTTRPAARPPRPVAPDACSSTRSGRGTGPARRRPGPVGAGPCGSTSTRRAGRARRPPSPASVARWSRSARTRGRPGAAGPASWRTSGGTTRWCSRDSARRLLRPDVRGCRRPVGLPRAGGTSSASATLSLASLPRPRYRRAFEPGCAIGVADRGSGRRAATSCSPSTGTERRGARRARRGRHRPRAGRAGWTCRDAWPDGMFDLVVLSELGYYLGAMTSTCCRPGRRIAGRRRHAASPATGGTRSPTTRSPATRCTTAARPQPGLHRVGPPPRGGLPSSTCWTRGAVPSPARARGPGDMTPPLRRWGWWCRPATRRICCPARSTRSSSPQPRWPGAGSGRPAGGRSTAARDGTAEVAPGPRGARRSRSELGVGRPGRGRPAFATCSDGSARAAAAASGWPRPTPTRGCPPDWLVRQLDLAEAGADLVVGTVEVDDWSAHPPYVEAPLAGRRTTGRTGTGTSTAPTSGPRRRLPGGRRLPGPWTATRMSRWSPPSRHRRVVRTGDHPGRHQRPAGQPGTRRFRRPPRRAWL